MVIAQILKLCLINLTDILYIKSSYQKEYDKINYINNV
jgi:hypothetical protein